MYVTCYIYYFIIFYISIQHIFLTLKMSKYYQKFEAQNPYAKLLSIKSKYPNKLVFYVSERQPCYVICSNNLSFILDKDYKIVEINNTTQNNLIEILCLADDKKVNFFDFFKISENADNLDTFYRALQYGNLPNTIPINCKLTLYPLPVN